MVYAMAKFAIAIFDRPRSIPVIVAFPLASFDSIYYDRLTTPLLPTVFTDPSKERGGRPVDWITLAVQLTPVLVLARRWVRAL